MMKFWDLVYVTTMVLALMAVADWRGNQSGDSPWMRENRNWHLGAEYDSIARAIYAGRGFSDPFKVESGPTAWMPPVLPYILSGLYWVTDFNPQIVIELVLGIKALIIVFTGLIVLAEARRLGFVWFGCLLFPLGLLANFYHFFQITHDLWLLLFVVNCLWLGLTYFWKPTNTLFQASVWGAFGGFAALCSPVIGAVWAIATVIGTCKHLARHSNGRADRTRLLFSLATAAFVSIFVVSPWTVRNRVVLGKWVPIKSNGAFELWQSQCLDDDGVLDRDLLSKHPWTTDGEQRARYLEVGEIEFIDEKYPEIAASLQKSPQELLRRVGNRAIAAFVDYTAASKQDEQRIWPMRFKRIVFPFPFLCAFAAWWFGWHQQRELQFTFALSIYGCTLLPYVLISYGDRYAAPLLAIKLILVLHGFAAIALAASSMRGSTLEVR